MNVFDSLLNKITMYKLVLWGLRFLVAISVIFSFFHLLPDSVPSLLGSFVLLVGVCLIANYLFAKLFRAATNTESYVITALILFFILSPIAKPNDIFIDVLAGFLAIGSKYILAYNKKHLFNPAALSAFLLGLFGIGNITWWVGSQILLPFTFILSLAVARKIRRLQMVFICIITALVTLTFINTFYNQRSGIEAILEIFTSWPLIFFAGIMFTEPLTTPPTKNLQRYYALIVGIFFGAQFHIGPLYTTPEFALLLGNIFSYIVSPKGRFILTLRKTKQIASSMYEFTFVSSQKFIFRAGQYLEWTLMHPKPDFRGNRRYFTIASSPADSEIKLAVRIEDNHSSSFKRALKNLKPGDSLTASQLAGDFVLPKETQKKIVFIAGGIGITPFVSMISSLLEQGVKKNITLFYSVSDEKELAYRSLFSEAEKKIGLRVVSVVTQKEHISESFHGKTGRIDKTMLTQAVRDYQEAIYYLSGPNAMVNGYAHLLRSLGIRKNKIKKDFFPGF